jgi:hypothetical protein
VSQQGTHAKWATVHAAIRDWPSTLRLAFLIGVLAFAPLGPATVMALWFR